jgi:hypothetical protein
MDLGVGKFLVTTEVVDAHANDLLGIRNRRQQADARQSKVRRFAGGDTSERVQSLGAQNR